MIDKISLLIDNGIAYLKKHPQVLMTLLLVIVIPIAFLVSSQQFLSAGKDNQESLEKERVGILHDIFALYIQAIQFDPDVMQYEIGRLAESNSDITQFRVVKEEGSNMHIIASLDTSLRNTIDINPTEYRVANVGVNESIIKPYAEDGIRYWESYRLVHTDAGENYYIFTETSLAKIDGIFASRIITAYYWLFGILTIVLVLVVRHVRLVDYSYLYHETKKANDMRDLFTNMITHELRAPLTAMRGYASMIRERTDVPHEVQSYALRIEESSSRLVLIVNDLLDVARIQSGRIAIVNASTNIQTVITRVLEAMQSSAQERNITFARDGVRGDVYINGDEKRLHQAFTNLVSNAIKYTKSGTITLGIEELSDRIEVRVKDTGMGISADNQKNLFAPFFRVNSSEVNQITGTGLGMWITKQLIELMKGSIGVESIRGVGTHIVITLPK
jgi:signal transduction histidine kinase